MGQAGDHGISSRQYLPRTVIFHDGSNHKGCCPVLFRRGCYSARSKCGAYELQWPNGDHCPDTDSLITLYVNGQPTRTATGTTGTHITRSGSVWRVNVRGMRRRRLAIKPRLLNMEQAMSR